MRTFKSDDELIAFFKSKKGKKELKEIAASSSKNGSGGSGGVVAVDAKAVMLDEANRLRDLIQREIEAFYNSRYTMYIKHLRTYGLSKSINPIDLNDVVEVTPSGGELRVTITFNPEKLTSTSILNDWYEGEYEDTYQGDKFDLIQGGWQVKKDVWFKNVYRFGYYEGYDFIGKAIKQFLSNNPNNIQVTWSSNIRNVNSR